MDTKKIEEIPALVTAGKITKTEAVNLIAQEIYNCPFRFGMAAYDEDFRSDVLLTFLMKGSLVIDRYIAGFGSFRSYLFAFVQGLILTQKRNQIRKMISENSVKQCISSEAPGFQEEEASPSAEKLSASEKPVKHSTGSNESVWKELSKRCRTTGISNAKTALILALKSSYYIPVESVDEVSSYCKLESAEIQRIIAELNSMLYMKVKRRNIISNRRDNAYYFHRKYYMQMKYCNKERTDMVALNAKYVKQTKNWKNKNDLLQKSRYRVCPTNKMIAKMLGICERQVSYYINRGKKLYEENKIIV
jgi:hypothetical protein